MGTTIQKDGSVVVDGKVVGRVTKTKVARSAKNPLGRKLVTKWTYCATGQAPNRLECVSRADAVASLLKLVSP